MVVAYVNSNHIAAAIAAIAPLLLLLCDFDRSAGVYTRLLDKVKVIESMLVS